MKSLLSVLKWFAIVFIALACALVAFYTICVFLPPMLTAGTFQSITGLALAALSLIPVVTFTTITLRHFNKE